MAKRDGKIKWVRMNSSALNFTPHHELAIVFLLKVKDNFSPPFKIPTVVFYIKYQLAFIHTPHLFY